MPSGTSRRHPRSAAAGLALAAMVAVAPGRAAGASQDAAARKAGERAMNEQFASASFKEARAAVEAAIEGCPACSPKVLAVLQVDLAIILVTGLRDKKKARVALDTALSLDPGVPLDPAWTTPEVRALYDAARAAAGAGTAPPGNESTATTSTGAPVQEVVLEDDAGDDQPRRRKRMHAAEVDPEPEEPACRSDEDCGAGSVCRGGACSLPPAPPREPAVWLSLGVIQDLAIVSGSNVCSQQSQVKGGFTCLRASGSQYHGTPLPGQGGSAGGLGVGPTRVTLATYLPLGRISAGLRFGYAFLGQGPRPDGGEAFQPLQAELQGAYWLTGPAFSTQTTGLFVLATGGTAQIDGATSVTVREDPGAPKPSHQLDNPESQKLDAYRKAGSGFAGAGAGVFLPFGRAGALLADLRLVMLFPSTGTALSLGVSGALGL